MTADRRDQQQQAAEDAEAALAGVLEDDRLDGTLGGLPLAVAVLDLLAEDGWRLTQVVPNPMTMRAVETEGFNLEASYAAAAEVGVGLVPDQAAEIAESLHGLTFDELTDRIAAALATARAEEAARWQAKIEELAMAWETKAQPGNRPRSFASVLRALLDGEQR